MNKKKVRVIISLFFVLLTIIPVHVEARNTDSYINYITVKKMDTKAKEKNTNKKETEEIKECQSILGDVNNEEDVAWLLQKLLNYMKILGPTIAIVLGSLDFTKAIISSDEENMKKSQKRFVYRLIAAVLLFFIPLLVEILLGLFNITTNNSICGLK